MSSYGRLSNCRATSFYILCTVYYAPSLTFIAMFSILWARFSERRFYILRIGMEKMMEQHSPMEHLLLDYESAAIGKSYILHADCMEWLNRIPESSIHAVVTDPPYGIKEYEYDQIEKRANGNGGVWRIPPTFDGHERAPLPRFTALQE